MNYGEIIINVCTVVIIKIAVRIKSNNNEQQINVNGIQLSYMNMNNCRINTYICIKISKIKTQQKFKQKLF